LVRRIALASWRSDRLAKLEAALLDGEAQREARRRGYPVDLPVDVWPDALVPLARHEAALDRAIQRAVTLLERHRGARGRGEMPSSFQTSLLEGEGNKNFVEQSQFCQPIQSACPTEANVDANLGRHPASSSTASPSIEGESGGGRSERTRPGQSTSGDDGSVTDGYNPADQNRPPEGWRGGT
jgi:hypothetical protein